MRKLALFPSLALAILSFAHFALASETSEPAIVGTWVLCQDPDNSPKDALEFYAEGYGFNIRPNMPKAPFLYQIDKETLMLLVNAKGKLTPLNLSVNAEITRITLKSEQTGSESFYVKIGQESANSCTAK